MTLAYLPDAPSKVESSSDMGTSRIKTRYQTIISFDSSIEHSSVDRVVFLWSTYSTSGSIDETDLVDFSYELLKDGKSIYSETVIAHGKVQSIGRLARTFEDLTFCFDLDTSTLENWDNYQNDFVVGRSVAEAYNIYDVGNFIFVDQYQRGVLTDSSGTTFSQLTKKLGDLTTPSDYLVDFGIMLKGGTGFLISQPQ